MFMPRMLMTTVLLVVTRFALASVLERGDKRAS